MRKNHVEVNEYCTDEAGYETLEEITGQESGIVIYKGQDCGDDAVYVCNWSFADAGTSPALFIGQFLLFIRDDEGYFLESKYEVDDISNEIPGRLVISEDGETCWYEGVEVMYDINDDLLQILGNRMKMEEVSETESDEDMELTPTGGTVYEFKNMIVIAPDGWA